MFDKLCKDIRVGDIVMFLLTTGKEVTGTILEIGEENVLIRSEGVNQIRIFDRLIGGWQNLTQNSSYVEDNEVTTTHDGHEKVIKKSILPEEDNTEEINIETNPILSLLFDPPYYFYSETSGETTSTLVIRNESLYPSEGFFLTLICKDIISHESYENSFENNEEIGPGEKAGLIIVIPNDFLIDSDAVDITIDVVEIFQSKKLTPHRFEFTLEQKPETYLTYDDIVWKDGTIPPEPLFKGRKTLINNLTQHYLSIERDKPYILYGLTRSGKSSILEYLKKDIIGYTVTSKESELTVLPFSWDFSEAASFNNESDFWYYILYQQTFEELENYSNSHSFNLNGFKLTENVRSKDFKIILDFLESKNIYPLFLIDEFSFIKTLFDDKIINTAFLHILRQYSLNGLASFIFAGTYDIRTLIKDPLYGITGQLVNAIELQVNEILPEYAIELIKVMDGNLTFTPKAIKHINLLSGNVPYFIQIICKNCGYYASDKKKRHIGYSDLEKVIQILVGVEQTNENTLVKKLPENTFQNNQSGLADPNEVRVIISCIAYLNADSIQPRGVGMDELQKLWIENKINNHSSKLADAITLLLDKKIILQKKVNGKHLYILSVDIFRRWWYYHYPDLNLILTTLVQ